MGGSEDVPFYKIDLSALYIEVDFFSQGQMALK